MSTVTQLQSLGTILGTEIKNIREATGDLSQLTVDQKSSLVAAINELLAIMNGELNALIDDTATSTESIYSSTKIDDVLNNAVTNLINNAPVAFDTLKEIADWISTDVAQAAAIQASIDKRVPYHEVIALAQNEIENVHETLDIGDYEILGDYYQAPLVPPPDMSIALWMDFENNVIEDTSEYGHVPTITGSVSLITDATMGSTKSLSMGDTSLIQFGPSEAFNFGTGDFEIVADFILKFVNDWAVMFNFIGPNVPYNASGGISIATVGDGVRFGVQRSGGNIVPDYTPAIALNEKYRLAFLRKDGVAYLVLNGSVVSSAPFESVFDMSPAGSALRIGYTGTNNTIRSTLDNIAIYKGRTVTI